MAKAHAMALAYDPTTNTILTSATVNVYTPGTVTPIGATIYDKNGNTLANPLTSDSTTGLIDFYLSVAQEVDLVVSKNGFTTRTYSNVPVLDDASNNLTALLTTTGDIVYASSANTPARLPVGTANQVLTVSGGVPSWTSTISGATLINTTSATFTGTAAAAGAIRLANGSGGNIDWRNGANNGDDLIGFDGSDHFVVTGIATSSTVGSAGSASAMPTPVEYWQVLINGNARKVALFNP